VRAAELACLCAVSTAPSRQCPRHPRGAFTGFFEGRAKYPRSKSQKKPRRSAEYTSPGFRHREGRLTLARPREPQEVVRSRPPPDSARASTPTVFQDAVGIDAGIT
jgi:putative transposase